MRHDFLYQWEKEEDNGENDKGAKEKWEMIKRNTQGKCGNP